MMGRGLKANKVRWKQNEYQGADEWVKSPVQDGIWEQVRVGSSGETGLREKWLEQKKTIQEQETTKQKE